MSHVRVLIVGSGPAGCTAAIYSARAMLEPAMVSGNERGGQMTTTTDVENYPGFSEVIQGPWLMGQMQKQAEAAGTRLISGAVKKVELGTRPFSVSLERGPVITCDTLILATGAKARWLGLPSEARFKGAGVSACATCDGFFFRRRDVVVVGGGNTAVEEALYMSNIASRVTLIHRRSELRAEQVLQNRMMERPNIDILMNTVLREVVGEGSPPLVTGAVVENVLTGRTLELKAGGVFVAIGHEPATELIRGQLQLKPSGYVCTQPGSTATSVPGVFAAGDVTDDTFRQAVTAAGMGCMAALEAQRYLQLEVRMPAVAA